MRKAAALRRFVRGHLGGGEEEHQVALEGVQDQRRGHAQDRQAGHDQRQAFVSRFHSAVVARPAPAPTAETTTRIAQQSSPPRRQEPQLGSDRSTPSPRRSPRRKNA